MLSVSREASNSRSLNGIITIEDGNGTTIENGVITANSIQVQQQLEIEGDLVCEDLVASGDIECLDLVASGDIGCENITVTTNIVSSTSSIGNMTSNFLNVGELQVGSISNVETEINGKAGLSGGTNNFTNVNLFNKRTTFKSFSDDGIYYGAMIITKSVSQPYGSLCLISGDTDQTALNVEKGDVVIDDNLQVGSISNVETEINGKAGLSGDPNYFTNNQFFNQIAVFSSVNSGNNIWNQAMVIRNIFTQPTGTSLCKIIGATDRTALLISQGDAVFNDNLQVGSILNVEAEINLKVATTTYASGISYLENALDLKNDKYTYDQGVITLNNSIDLKLNTSVYNAGLIVLNVAIQSKLPTSTYISGLVTLNTAIDGKVATTTYNAGLVALNAEISNRAKLTGTNNSFTNVSVFNKTTYLKSFSDDGNYYGAMVITNSSAQGTGTNLCLITGDTDRTALNVDQGNVIFDDNLKLGTINDVEAEIISKVATTTYASGLVTLNTAIDGKSKLTGSPNNFTNINFFNRTTYLKSFYDDGIYYGAMVITNPSAQGTGTNLCVIRGDNDRTALNVEVGDVIIEDNLKVGTLSDVETAILSKAPKASPTFTGDMVLANNLAGDSQLLFYEGSTNNAKISQTAFESTNVTSRCLKFEILASQLVEGFRFCSTAVQLFRIDANGNTNTKGHHVFNASASNASAILGEGQTTTYCTDTQIQFRYKTTNGAIKTKTFNWD